MLEDLLIKQTSITVCPETYPLRASCCVWMVSRPSIATAWRSSRPFWILIIWSICSSVYNSTSIIIYFKGWHYAMLFLVIYPFKRIFTNTCITSLTISCISIWCGCRSSITISPYQSVTRWRCYSLTDSL